MSMGVELTISNVISGATLMTVATLAAKGVSAWTKLTATQDSQSNNLRDIKAILGNGEPGAVVKRQVCEALHNGVEKQLDAIHEEILSLHDAVRELHKR